VIWYRTLCVVLVLVISGGFTMQAPAAESLKTRQVLVNAVDLTYLDQGTGAPVVFVHGSFSDLRFWEPQRQAIAQQYRFIALTQRYFGTTPWPDDGKHYADTTHAADLAAFLRQINAGPVHLVGISYGGVVATLVALEHSDLLRSLTVLEPGLVSLLADVPEAKPEIEERRKAFQPIATAAKTGETVQATKLLFEYVNNEGAGAFDKQPETVRQMFLDNARTVPLALSAPRAPAVTCATLGGVKTPTLVAGGERTRRYYSLINAALVRCIPGSRLVTIPKATHPMSIQNPAAFNEVLLQFLAQR
jgi:pimeloyl-ACP methyl ester carboxylesterase